MHKLDNIRAVCNNKFLSVNHITASFVQPYFIHANGIARLLQSASCLMAFIPLLAAY